MSEGKTMHIDDDTVPSFAKLMMERLERRFPEQTKEQIAERWLEPKLAAKLRESGYFD